jgi:hypothetical protein
LELTAKQFWKSEINTQDKVDASDLQRDSLFLSGFSLVCFGILLNFDPVQLKILLDPNIGLRIHPWLFMCIVLFVTCSQFCRRIKYRYEYVLADLLYMAGIFLLYFSLSTIVFRMRMDLVTIMALVGLMGLLIYKQVLILISIIQFKRQ